MGSNISEKYKCEWVAPERTGSRKVAEILTFYGFKNNENPIYSCNNHFHRHNGPNEKYGDYLLICNARNPYSRTYSIFKNLYPVQQDKSKESFKKFLFQELESSYVKNMVINPIFSRKPNHIIRLENIFEDLIKLPFIFDVLTEPQVKMLSSHGKLLDEWEQFYDQETKEFVFDLTKHHFHEWGYEK